MSLSGHFHLAAGGFLDAPSLTSSCSNLPFETQGEVMEAAFCSVQTRKWETESFPFPGPPPPPGFCLASVRGCWRGACGRSVALGEVVREQPPWKDWHPCEEISRELHPPVSSLQPSMSGNRQEGSHQSPSTLHPGLRLPASRTVEVSFRH